MENKLDISALKKAVRAFDNVAAFALMVEAKPPGELEFYELETARAAVIQHFEFSYELCWKTMKRYIEMDIGSEADILTRKDIFRISAERQLIADFDKWVEFHKARNRTSHIYDEEAADEVYQIAKFFSSYLHQFAETIEKRI
ncbi:MAG: nucleotidyltransferase substrate binding protein [Treponema sp.]|jgi:nucleotidyltransferase substrate binding protein (TIGR01987 family)|nr:nucleotidyltransferase substrate binding protein [Treponema sp.]